MNLKVMALLLVWFATGGVANWLFYQMVSDVNRRLPESEQFDYLWWNWSKHERLWRKHRELFPGSKKRLATVIAAVILVTGVFGILPYWERNP